MFTLLNVLYRTLGALFVLQVATWNSHDLDASLSFSL